MTPEKFKDLYLAYCKPLINHASRITCDPTTAQDVVHNVFEKLLKLTEEDESEIKNYGAWLFKCTHNKSLDYLKAIKRKQNGIREHVRSLDGRDTDLDHYTKLFNVFIRDINPKKAEVFIMHKVEGIPQAEIAKRMDLSIQRIKNIIYEVTKKLREEVRSPRGNFFACEDSIE